MTFTKDRLEELGIELPQIVPASYTYVPFKKIDRLIFISGQVPRLSDGSFLTGKVGLDCSFDEAREAARLCGKHLLSVARSVTGSLDDIEFLKVFGMVNAVPDFRDHARVMEGCSQLLVEVLGDRGRHARSAVGMGSLPAHVRVEIEAVIAIVN